jgi:membrane-associated phospholipid phosphatase
VSQPPTAIAASYDAAASVVTSAPLAPDPAAARIGWSTVAQSFTRPYKVTPAMVGLVCLGPFYIFIAATLQGRTLHVPALALDRALPLHPAWAIVYGSLYGFLIVVPVLVVRQEEQIRRTVRAYLMVWIVAFACFLLYPTAASRPAEVVGEGFFAWGLRALYSADPPYNCFPSLHVAHSLISALTCYRVHRGVGAISLGFVGLIGLSTLYTKQHYVLDVIAGMALAGVASLVFLRGDPRAAVPELERRLAPVLAAGTMALVGLVVLGFWIVYRCTRG